VKIPNQVSIQFHGSEQLMKMIHTAVFLVCTSQKQR